METPRLDGQENGVCGWLPNTHRVMDVLVRDVCGGEQLYRSKPKAVPPHEWCNRIDAD
jgi:hypothetical protein